MTDIREPETIIKKVLKEMEMAEEFVRDWKVSWSEQLRKCFCKDLENISEKDFLNLRSRYVEYIELPKVDQPCIKDGLPLRKLTLLDGAGHEYICEFREIGWNYMCSNDFERTFTFSNNGDITLSKDIKIKTHDSYHRNRNIPKNPQRVIMYNAKFNVSSSDFSIEFLTKELYPGSKENYKVDRCSFYLTGTMLVKKVNDIQIVEDLTTGIKSVSITKKHDKHDKQNNASVAFEATLTPDNGLEVGSVVIRTYKSKGKVNGNYRFDVSRKKGVRANFYSRKGKKIDLIENPLFLKTAKKLLTAEESDTTSKEIITGFTKSTEKAITKNLKEKVISFDARDFNMNAIREADEKIIYLVKCIKGEIPLNGLRDRIDYCLELIGRPKTNVIDVKPKMLALESKIVE